MITELIEGSKILQIIIVVLVCATCICVFFYGEPLDDDSRDQG